ncbi:neutrophil elastase-like isoform X1 [Cimex lectularius]|uniref:Peptidase S1 domain-containing protein n=2 Tax=Cimex lectularius TaxID=79782 RepID=A0A8I6SLS2_CIMLE|nr:neutrophil elastase-like isoform X1 [Cimex lectularius]
MCSVLPFEFSEKVSVVPLSDEMWPQGDQMYNVPCVAAGWGRHEMGGKLATHLQKLDVTARHGEDGCVCDLPFQNKRLVCISGKAGKGLCAGDSGSVLVCNKKAVGVAHIIYLEEACNPFRIRMPKLSCKQSLSAFMYICPFLDWIRKHVPDVPGTPISCNGCKISSSLVKVVVLNILLKFQAINIYLS